MPTTTDKEKLKYFLHNYIKPLPLPDMETEEGKVQLELIKDYLKGLTNVIDNCISKL